MDFLAKQLAKEEADYTFQEEVQQALRAAKRVRMTEQQKIEYKLYREGCRLNGVEPVRADFLAAEIPNCVTYHMELEQNENEWERRKVMAAVAGR